MLFLHLKKLFIYALLMLSAGAVADELGNWQKKREKLVSVIEKAVEETKGYTGREKLSKDVMRQIATVPRHEFVPVYEKFSAYLNRPLPIGYGQTISQPYIVALMTDLLEPQKDHVVLEVGTGSGYQAAILSGLVKHVYTVEIIAPLASDAEKRLEQLGYGNVTVAHADGYYGWEQHAPFDSIIVTAAAGQVPPPLIKQLRNGGKMIIPVGNRFSTQYLVLVEKTLSGEVTTRHILPVRFVPLTGGH